jgi:hypothetical protein
MLYCKEYSHKNAGELLKKKKINDKKELDASHETSPLKTSTC